MPMRRFDPSSVRLGATQKYVGRPEALYSPLESEVKLRPQVLSVLLHYEHQAHDMINQESHDTYQSRR